MKYKSIKHYKRPVKKKDKELHYYNMLFKFLYDCSNKHNIKHQITSANFKHITHFPFFLANVKIILGSP